MIFSSLVFAGNSQIQTGIFIDQKDLEEMFYSIKDLIE
jgi:hypothetical protein